MTRREECRRGGLSCGVHAACEDSADVFSLMVTCKGGGSAKTP